MKAIHLVAVVSPPALSTGSLDLGRRLLEELGVALAGIFRVPCRVRSERLDASFAFDPLRNQYRSTAILQRLERILPELAPHDDARLLGVTALDLYVPVLTFVFGEAQLQGPCALVSTHRLREEFYGLPPSNDLLHERVTKEAVHEMGHTFGLRHCPDWRCVMASAHAVERLDVKTADFCPACQQLMAAPVPTVR